jgi:hypothetical protein
MIKPLPRWLLQRYAVLWAKVKTDKFDFNAAKKILGDNEGVLNVVLSGLRKLGWLKVEFDPHDARKRVYNIVPLEKAFEELAKNKKAIIKKC